MDDFDYLKVKSEDKQVLSNLSKMGEQLKNLKTKMLEAEALYDAAKKEYEHYAHVLIPAEMFSAGVDVIGLSSGGVLKVKRNYYCQPNKNEADQKIIREWLRANGGGNLVNSEAKVSSEDMELLRDANIPFIEGSSVNTNSLKAFLKDKLGITSGVQQIKLEDIPSCIHFQEVTTVEVEL